MKLFLTNYLAGRENEGALVKLNQETYIIQAEDSGKDLETGTCRSRLCEP